MNDEDYRNFENELVRIWRATRAARDIRWSSLTPPITTIDQLSVTLTIQRHECEDLLNGVPVLHFLCRPDEHLAKLDSYIRIHQENHLGALDDEAEYGLDQIVFPISDAVARFLTGLYRQLPATSDRLTDARFGPFEIRDSDDEKRPSWSLNFLRTDIETDIQKTFERLPAEAMYLNEANDDWEPLHGANKGFAVWLRVHAIKGALRDGGIPCPPLLNDAMPAFLEKVSTGVTRFTDPFDIGPVEKRKTRQIDIEFPKGGNAPNWEDLTDALSPAGLRALFKAYTLFQKMPSFASINYRDNGGNAEDLERLRTISRIGFKNLASPESFSLLQCIQKDDEEYFSIGVKAGFIRIPASVLRLHLGREEKKFLLIVRTALMPQQSIDYYWKTLANDYFSGQEGRANDFLQDLKVTCTKIGWGFRKDGGTITISKPLPGLETRVTLIDPT